MIFKKTAAKLPRIVVVGGGAGGLELVTTLGRKLGKPRKAKIYLSDGSPTHIWKPLLHEVSTGSFNVGEDEVSYLNHSSIYGYRFHYGWMKGLDRKKKVIMTDHIMDLEGNCICGPREFRYDTLIMAVGAQTNNFGVKGVDEYCLRLDSIVEAERLRKRFFSHALALAFGKIPSIKVGIVGGGPTGVELACEIHRTMIEIRSLGVAIKKDSLQITIIEAGPTLLPGTLPHMEAFARKQLEAKGIEIKTNAQIVGVTEEGFQLKDGSVLKKDIKIWTAGIKAPEWLAKTGLQVDQINRIKVNQFLQSLDDPSIYAIGDCSHCPDPNQPDRTYPATAQCAHQQAEWLAKKLIKETKGRKYEQPFVFQSQGMLVSLGHTTAVGTVHQIKPKLDLHLRGRSAKFLYSTLYRMHQAAVYGNLRAFGILVGDKLRGITLPQVKLH